jgi:hypothetical protein
MNNYNDQHKFSVFTNSNWRSEITGIHHLFKLHKITIVKLA